MHTASNPMGNCRPMKSPSKHPRIVEMKRIAVKIQGDDILLVDGTVKSGSEDKEERVSEMRPFWSSLSGTWV